MLIGCVASMLACTHSLSQGKAQSHICTPTRTAFIHKSGCRWRRAPSCFASLRQRFTSISSYESPRKRRDVGVALCPFLDLCECLNAPREKLCANGRSLSMRERSKFKRTYRPATTELLLPTSQICRLTYSIIYSYYQLNTK